MVRTPRSRWALGRSGGRLRWTWLLRFRLIGSRRLEFEGFRRTDGRIVLWTDGARRRESLVLLVCSDEKNGV